MKPFKKYLAEFFGTMVLVALACGTAIVTKCGTEPVGYILTALAFGLVIVAMAYSIGSVSGCHINPAVSLAMLISKKMTFKEFIGYVIAQCLGAIAGAAILLALFGKDCGFGANAVIDVTAGGVIKSLVVEAILTGVFVFAILGVTSDEKNSKVSGLVIGLTLTLVHLFGIGLTGTSVNPARSLGPAIFAGGENLCYVWVFIVGPLVGGAAAALLWNYFCPKKKNKKQ